MRHSLHQQQEISSTPAASFGRVGRCIAITRVEAAASGSANDAIVVPATVATALRAVAANGFGDAPLTVSDDWHRFRPRLEAAARTHRSHAVGRILAALVTGIVGRVRRVANRIEQRSRMRATALTLAALDSRTLRDLGFDRSEILSIAAELGGSFEATRVHTLRARITIEDRS